MSRLARMAEMLNAYWDLMEVPHAVEDRWITEPQASMQAAVAGMRRMRDYLADVHAECPEYDALLFGGAPGLVDRLEQCARKRKRSI